MQDVLDIHQSTIEHEGGANGIRDIRLLDAAVSTPRQTFGSEYMHTSPAAMAAASLFHIVKNHPFVDGNTRAGLAAAVVFLYANNIEFAGDPDEATEVTLAVASSSMTKETLVAWFERACG